MTDKTGGPAFPNASEVNHQGMTLLDYFAASALPGLISLNSDADVKGIASDAFLYADAMLKERNKWRNK